jgi:SHS2 domain-containing protein
LPRFELLEHTSDVYVRASGEDLLDALVGLGMGLTSVLVRNPESVAGNEKKDVSVEANGPEELVFLWLAELIYLFDASSFLFKGFEGRVRCERGKLLLQGAATGDVYDPSRHKPGTHVKAVTYHDMRVETCKGTTTVTVLLDI